MQLTKLQNGSDIRGVAIQTEGGKRVDLTPDAAYAIGRAFARVLKAKLNKDDIRVCMGRYKKPAWQKRQPRTQPRSTSMLARS